MKPITDQDRALEICKRAYLKDIPNDSIIGIKAKNDSCCIEIHDDHIEIGIAGSNDWKDWVHNFRLIGTKSKLGRVHRGFYTNVEKMVDKITFHIKRHSHLPILVRLHSRGGPIGCGVVYELKLKGYSVRSVVGCGIPNFLKEEGANRFKALGIPEVIFYRHGSDPVSNLLSWFYTKPVKDTEYGKKRFRFSLIKIKDHDIVKYIQNFPQRLRKR